MSTEQPVSHRSSRRRRSSSRWNPKVVAATVVAVVAATVLGYVGYWAATRDSPANAGPSGGPAPVATEASSTATHTPSVVPPTPTDVGPSAELSTSFGELQESLGKNIGLSVAPIGAPDRVQSFGAWTSGPAWSTSKVPLALALLHEVGPENLPDTVRAAITQSDNAAAQSMWEQLGDSDTAGEKVDAVFAAAGDPTTHVQRTVTRPGFSAFGQTDWSLVNQARFLANTTCDAANAPVFKLMGDIEQGQRWGLGSADGARFKGGWGPGADDGYLVRQFGVINVGGGQLAVAMAAKPSSGGFGDGTAELTSIASWVEKHSAEFAPGTCGPSQ